MSHDYSMIAREILDNLGGRENLEQAAHCVTRLRLALKDPSLVNSSALNQVDLVKGSFFTGGLFQVVIGPGEVEKVYAALRELTGLAASTIADVKKAGGDKTNPMQRLVRVFSDVFMPILPALIIAGLLMGVNNLMGAKGMFIEGKTLLEAYPNLDGLWSLINLMANTSFVFLPALVGWSAAKRFGGSEILGIVLGLMLVHPDLLNAWNYGKAVAGLDGQSLPYFDIFGWFQIEKVGYQGQILPILMAAFVMSVIEKWLRTRVPNAIQLLVVPITTIVVTGVLALAIIGPVTRHLGILITEGLVTLFEIAPDDRRRDFRPALRATGDHRHAPHVPGRRPAAYLYPGRHFYLADDRHVQPGPGQRRPRGVLHDPQCAGQKHGLDLGDFRLLRHH